MRHSDEALAEIQSRDDEIVELESQLRDRERLLKDAARLINKMASYIEPSCENDREECNCKTHQLLAEASEWS